MPGRISFKLDQDVLGATILEIACEGPIATARYRVRYACCGSEGWISHAGMLQRRRRKAVRCNQCATKLEHRKRPTSSEEMAMLPRCEFGVVHDRHGLPWPRLGPLGPRWAGDVRHNGTRSGAR